MTTTNKQEHETSGTTRRWPSRTPPARHRQPRGWPTAASGVRPTLVSYSVVNPLWETGASATGMIDADQRL